MARLRRIAVERDLDGRLARAVDLGPGPVPIGIKPEAAWEAGRRFPGLDRAFVPAVAHVEAGVLPDGYYLLDG